MQNGVAPLIPPNLALSDPSVGFCVGHEDIELRWARPFLHMLGKVAWKIGKVKPVLRLDSWTLAGFSRLH